ncbi:3-hydroxyacyl-CoA dehydrogenase NAD-binding domain-containing protein [Stieleria varia]|uniref:enoyl-CoA hydratase n=1 Tax=Stieleria varia TaxID=2528005 RepID=A0A5C6AJT5_9BACT|nr:3-hydroxyacyl-CoA dehydrogenase NAD-binding domain-containing protein [Stieleria varia]TWT98463.1 Fatty acid oxidation complex subunit alpha [Stieleria varia]
MNAHDYKNFTVTEVGAICHVVLDVPNRPMNVLQHDVMTELERIVSDLEENVTASVVLFESGKESGFLAGADIAIIESIQSPEQAEALLVAGQSLFARIERLRMKTVAVLHGPCLGGGLEWALACDHRLARDNSSTKIGLPEIKLGLIPGWGGTQRLPARVGLAAGLKMILQGTQVDAGRAARMGLVDRAIKPENWTEEVNAFAHLLATGKKPRQRIVRRWFSRLIDSTSMGRRYILKTARRSIAKHADHYPALSSAIDAISDGYRGDRSGFDTERSEFIKLLATPTCRQLLRLFFARESARNPRTWTPGETRAVMELPIRKVGVVGAGAMGAGIGQLAATRGYSVCLKEIDAATAEKARVNVDRMIDEYADRKRFDDGQRVDLRSKVSVTALQVDLADADLIVEAVVERMDVKQRVLGDLEPMVAKHCILATNTSSLSVAEMSKGLQRPDNFAGLHFFNPVHAMELVEIVRGPTTSEATVARLVTLVRALGKTPIVTNDSPGFLVNRVLFPYLGEAIRMVAEGHSVESIDRAVKRFGMPMGPLELLDQVGLDVALHVAGGLQSVLPDASAVIDTLQTMVDRGHLGKKTKVGFYDYHEKRKRVAVTQQKSRRVMPATIPGGFPGDSLDDTQRRLVYPMLAESVRCLEEHVVADAWAIDLAMVLGTGFAPHRGGPLSVIDSIGADRVMGNMKILRSIHGPRFSPPESLIAMAGSGQRFLATSLSKQPATAKP